MSQDELTVHGPARVSRGPDDPEPEQEPDSQERSPSPPDPGASLNGLLKVSVLTPAQAVYVAAELLDSEVARGGPDARLVARVTADGVVVVREAAFAGAGVTLPELQEALLASARHLPAHPRPHQQALLRRLEEPVVGADGGQAPGRALREALQEALGPTAEARVRRELAALVEAYGHLAGPAPWRPSSNGTSPPRPREELRPPEYPPRRRDLGRRRPRTRYVLTAVVVLALALGAGAYLVLRDPGVGQADASGAADRGTPSSPEPDDGSRPSRTDDSDGGQARPVPELAGSAAGRVRGVTLETNGSCTPGAACPVTVTVRLAAADTSQVIGWRVGAVRACRPQVAWSPRTTVTAQPGWTTVYASSSVQVPRGADLALVALTSTPARAQSRPVVVAGALRC
jgi:hypothetical protein